MKKQYLDQTPAPAWKNYIRKPEVIRAKLFELGDQDGYQKLGGDIVIDPIKVPYIYLAGQGKQLAEFGSAYIIIDDEGTRYLKNKTEFLNLFESIE